MPRIKIEGLHLDYEVRVIEERPWYQRLMAADYRSKPVLMGIDADWSAPGVVAVLGRNGSGKTTFIKTMTGLLKPTRGQIRINEFEPHRQQRAFLSQIGAVFGQKRMLWPELSLQENYELLAAIYRIPSEASRERIEELADLFELRSFWNRPTKTYSLGESMRAEVAAALLHKPSILFLDEPTVGMDLESQVQMRDALKEYARKEDCLLILTSHNTKDIASLADRIFFLKEGRLSEVEDIDGNVIERALKIEARLLSS